MKIRNKQLYENLKNIIISAFKLLKEYRDKDPSSPSILREIVTFDKDGATHTSIIEKPDFVHYLNSTEKEIYSLSEFKQVSEFFKNDERLKLLQKIEGKTVHNASASFVISNFLLRLAENIGSFKFNINKFNRLYEDYEGYLYLDIFNYQCFCLLMNFQSDIGNIRLDNGIVIKKVSSDDRERIWKMRTLPTFEFFSIIWIMHVQVNLKRGEKFSYQFPGKTFDDLVTALRLLKAGIVGYKHIYYYSLSKWEASLSVNLKERDFSGKMYTLSKSEVYKFKKWWGEFKKLKAPKIKKEVDIAINRFNYSYERTKLEDKLIDYIIAFESLLLEGEPEKRYKFSLRGAFLLGKDLKDPQKRYVYMKKVKQFLGEAYKLRNNIVHGSKSLKEKVVIDNKEILIQKFIEEIEEYLRESIKVFWKISKGKSKKEILKELDDAIFNIS